MCKYNRNLRFHHSAIKSLFSNPSAVLLVQCLEPGEHTVVQGLHFCVFAAAAAAVFPGIDALDSFCLALSAVTVALEVTATVCIDVEVKALSSQESPGQGLFHPGPSLRQGLS